tara:strand:- start:19723 stop:20079 length:357 start_codon:yes stop_codon:yes gene_type:complete
MTMIRFEKTKYKVIQREQIGKEKHARGSKGGVVEFYVQYKGAYLLIGVFNKSEVQLLLKNDTSHADWNDVMALFTKTKRDAGVNSYVGGVLLYSDFKDFVNNKNIIGHNIHLFNITSS